MATANYKGTHSFADGIDGINQMSLLNQTIDGGVSTGNFVAYDTSSSSWKKSGTGIFGTPMGVYVGSNKVVLMGDVNVFSGLTAGQAYWLSDSYTLTTDAPNSYYKMFVGFALSTTRMLFLPRIEGSQFSIRPNSGGYGYFAGGDDGASNFSNVIDYFDTNLTTGNATDTGDLTVARTSAGGCYGAQYGFTGGGGLSASVSNVIDYITMNIATQNATDTGDLTVARQQLCGTKGTSYGFFCGGVDFSSNYKNEVDYITLSSTTGNATDKGDLTVARSQVAGGIDGANYGFICGGTDGTAKDTIDYINVTTTSGNATDTGNLVAARRQAQGVSHHETSNYGFIGGGFDTGYSTVIEYIDVTSTTQNASDKGDLTVGRQMGQQGACGVNYGFFGGGLTTVTVQDVIDYIALTTTAENATDRGNLTVARRMCSGLGG